MFNYRAVLPVFSRHKNISFQTVYNRQTIKKASLYPVNDLTALYKSVLHSNSRGTQFLNYICAYNFTVLLD